MWRNDLSGKTEKLNQLRKKKVHKTPAPKKSDEGGPAKGPVASPISETPSFGSRSDHSSHASQEVEDGSGETENEGGSGVDLLTDFEITEVPAKSVQVDKGGQQGQSDGDGFSDPPTSMGSDERSHSGSLGSGSRSQFSSVNRGAVEKLTFALRSIKGEFHLSPTELESVVEEALRHLSSQSIVPSQSASSLDSGEDEGNPFEDGDEETPTTTQPQPQKILPSSSSNRSTGPLTSSVPSASSLFPDLLGETPSSHPAPSLYQQPQPQPQQYHHPQSHPQPHPQSYQPQSQQMYGRPPVPQGGFGYGQPYSYGGFGGTPGGPGPYGPGGGPGVGGFQNGYGMPVTGSYQQPQTTAQAPKGPDLFATLDPFA